MARNNRDQATDVELAKSALDFRGVTAFRNLGTKDSPQWVLIAPTSRLAELVKSGKPALIVSSRGDESYVLPTGIIPMDGQSSVTAYTDDADGQEVEVKVTAFDFERLNVPQPPKERHAASYRFSPRRESKPRSTVKVDDRAALLAALAALDETSTTPAPTGASVITSKGAKGKGASKAATTTATTATTVAAPTTTTVDLLALLEQ